MAGTLWPLDEQTEGKHLVLRRYLDGWFPILGRWNGRLLFVDGFAGPGHERPAFERSLDELFGTRVWRKSLDIEDEPDRKKFLHELFAKQLKRHGAKYVVTFELWKGNRHVYTLYFTTGDPKRCNLMKESIWKVDPSGSFAFRSHVAGLGTLFGPDTDQLGRQLHARFRDEWTPIERIDDFVMGDETPFHLGHLRRSTLQPLERDGEIEVSRPHGGRGFRRDRGIQVRFR